MKKSLSLLLSGAMVFGLFASAVSAAETPELTAQQKFEALKAKGIFAGLADGSAGLDQEMTRAQAARIIALLKGLEGIGDPDTRVVTEKPFPDVDLGKWYTEEIDAVKADGSFKGNADGTFNPNGDLSVQELAVAVAAALGFDAANAEAVEIEGAASWAGSSIKYLQDNGYAVPTNYTQPATRGQLVEATYVADSILDPVAPAKVSVAAAKAAGVQKVEVTLNKAVDKEKATLTLKRGSTTIATKATWAEDTKSAVLALTDSKIGAGEYTVTLGGLDEETIDNATAKFTATAEEVKAIEFVSATDTVAFSKFATLKLKATNQYGEAASIGASGFSGFVMGTQYALTKDDDGYLTLQFDSQALGLIQGQGMVPVNVYYNDTRVAVNKTFKLGTAPFLTKVELGDVKYSNNGTSLVSKDDTAVISMKLFDQWGNPIIAKQMQGGTPEVSPTTINANVTPYSPNLVYDNTQLFDVNDNPQVVIKLNQKEDKTSDYTVTVFAGSGSTSTTISVGAGKLATKIAFGTFDGNVAAGDTKDFYIPLVATDEAGNQLSAQDIVDNDKLNRFTFSGSNTTATPVIERYGDKKGQLKFNLAAGVKARSSVYLTALIATVNANSYDQTSINVQEQRYPDHIVVKDEPAAKAILGAGGDFKFLVKDQYGDDIGNVANGIPNSNGQTADYQVVVTITGETATAGISFNDKAVAPAVVTNYNHGAPSHTYTNAEIAEFNRGFHFSSTDGSTGKVTIKAVVQKDTGTGFSDYSSTISRTIEAIKPDADLTYSIDTLGTIYSSIDSHPAGIVGPDLDIEDSDNFFRKKLKIIAKDTAGNKVEIPNNAIRGISTSEQAFARVFYDDVIVPTSNDAYVQGNKAGTATVTAVVYTNKGTSVTLTQEITVKNETIKVDSISGDKKSATYAGQDNVFDLFNGLTVKDQYGKEYKSYNDADIAGGKVNEVTKYDAVLGVRYSITSVADGVAQVDAKTGKFIGTPTAKEFVITATAPSGKTAQVVVKNP